jgi:tRNA(Ser,Leu) C12 N-acetylase TAN1
MKDQAADELMGGEEPKEEKPLFTPEEMAEIEREAEERVRNAMREAEKARLIAQRIEELKKAEGQKAGIPDLDEIVEVYIDLPEFAANLRVNNDVFWHGYKYRVPRHVVNSLREMMQRAHQHQDIAEGKDLAAQYRNRDRHGREINAPVLSGGEAR